MIFSKTRLRLTDKWCTGARDPERHIGPARDRSDLFDLSNRSHPHYRFRQAFRRRAYPTIRKCTKVCRKALHRRPKTSIRVIWTTSPLTHRRLYECRWQACWSEVRNYAIDVRQADAPDVYSEPVAVYAYQRQGPAQTFAATSNAGTMTIGGYPSGLSEADFNWV